VYGGGMKDILSFLIIFIVIIMGFYLYADSFGSKSCSPDFPEHCSNSQKEFPY